MSNNIARIMVFSEHIRKELQLPEGTIIHDIRRLDDFSGVFYFLVEHDDLPEVLTGDLPPEVTPTITVNSENKVVQFLWGADEV